MSALASTLESESFPNSKELTLAAKLVVTADKGGSRIALVGASGKELLTSVVFSEPRAKGATLRSLKGLLGDDIVVEDQTLSSPRGRGKASSDGNGAVPAPATAPAAAASTTKKTAKKATRPATKPTAKPAEAAAEAPAQVTETAATAVKSVAKKAKRSGRPASKSVKTAAKG
jgi:hypothetical protein